MINKTIYKGISNARNVSISESQKNQTDKSPCFKLDRVSLQIPITELIMTSFGNIFNF